MTQLTLNRQGPEILELNIEVKFFMTKEEQKGIAEKVIREANEKV